MQIQNLRDRTFVIRLRLYEYEPICRYAYLRIRSYLSVLYRRYLLLYTCQYTCMIIRTSKTAVIIVCPHRFLTLAFHHRDPTNVALLKVHY